MSRMRTFQRRIDSNAVARAIQVQQTKGAAIIAEQATWQLDLDYCNACERLYSRSNGCQCETFEAEV